MELNVGLIGLGTIGSGVIDVLNRNNALIEKRTGIKINLKKVCDLNIEKIKGLKISPEIYTNNYDDIVDDPAIDIVVELIGGYEPAKTIILNALRKKKHVVTANKAVISRYFNEIFNESKKNRTNFCFEASVGGCIPILGSIKDKFAAENIKSLYGILNGTTNFILTKMEEGLSYEEALKVAQEKGFAEQDPGFDVEGADAAMKLGILASFICNAPIKAEIHTEGIKDITKNDIAYTSDLGYSIKLLAILKRCNGDIELRVHPTLIPKEHELASVADEFNAVLVKGDNIGPSLLYGLGAGKLPTASTVINDIILIGKRIKNNTYEPPITFFNKFTIKNIDNVESKYYIRFSVIDKAGVLARISAILSEYNVSISGVWVKGKKNELISLIMTTHEALNKDIIEAVKKIDNSKDLVEGRSRIIRIEDLKTNGR